MVYWPLNPCSSRPDASSALRCWKIPLEVCRCFLGLAWSDWRTCPYDGGVASAGVGAAGAGGRVAPSIQDLVERIAV